MGRRKIEIKFIDEDRNRNVTFIKRKNGLFKKAHELSILTGAKVTVHVEDIKEREYDYVSGNAGGDAALQNFQSDDDEDDGNSAYGQEEMHEGDFHESASSIGSGPTIVNKRDSGVYKPGDRRSQSSIHLSPNPGVPNSRRSSGHPYPRSPGPVPSSAVSGLTRPASMDFTMNYPAGGPQRKASVPSMPLTPVFPQQPNIQFQFPVQSQFQAAPNPQNAQNHPQQLQSAAPFYFNANQSQPSFATYDGQQQYIQQQQRQQFIQQQQQQQQQQMAVTKPQQHQPRPHPQQPQQQMPRYNGNLFQANGHPATNSQRHMPAYPSNLVPSAGRPHSGTLPSSNEPDSAYSEYSQSVGFGDYLDDDLDPEFDPLGTQASTPANYDFSTNPSLTNLSTTANVVQSQNRNPGIGINVNNTNMYGGQYTLAQQQAMLQQQQHAAQRSGFYNNPSGAQSTPNLAWSLAQNQMSPQASRRA